ncbi:hypothetical protein NDU88_001538 [Pleurodeles waltl]|uniref:Uncharacterized protein n=1 Tax=Pleurodeles waltl TaxID=8319 RepID=A0AAV7MKQ4_PLEWA|nr:hypothetical protein NDU88_001538 [Pleurodeles waltl]
MRPPPVTSEAASTCWEDQTLPRLLPLNPGEVEKEVCSAQRLHHGKSPLPWGQIQGRERPTELNMEAPPTELHAGKGRLAMPSAESAACRLPNIRCH